MLGDAGCLAHVGKCAVSVVVEEPARLGVEGRGNAVVAHPGGILAAAVQQVELGELADKQVQLAIVVIVEPDCARAPSGRAHARLLGHVREGAVAVVAVEDIAPHLRHINVRIAVPVVIPHGDAHPIASSGAPRLFRHIGESSVAIVAVKRIPQRLGRIVEVRFAAVDEIDVHPAVIVVIQEGASRPAALRQVLLRGSARVVYPANAALRGRHLLEGVGRGR